VEEIVHFYFHVQDEVSAVEKLSQGGLTVELPWYVNIDLLSDLLQLVNS
jgi:hypothetical protein